MPETETMRAQVLKAFNQPYELTQLPRPSPPKGVDILVRVQAASYCHTDAVFSAGLMQQGLPRINSHEFAGEVVALGESVATSRGLAVGSRVGVPGRAYHPCGSCKECVANEGDPEGFSSYCPHASNLGLTRDGGFQEFCLVDSRQIARIPEQMSAVETAPLMCAGLTVWAALKRCALKKGSKVAIMGAGGGLGHLGIQFAAKLGYDVLAVDAADGPLKLVTAIANDLAKSSSAKVSVVDARTDPAEQALKAIGEDRTGERDGEFGVDAVMMLPESQAAFDYGMKLLRDHGTCVVVSFPEKGFHFSAKDVVFRDIKIIGSLIGRNRQLQDMLDFAAENGIRANVRVFPLEKLNELVKEYHKGEGGKLVVDMKMTA